MQPRSLGDAAGRHVLNGSTVISDNYPTERGSTASAASTVAGSGAPHNFNKELFASTYSKAKSRKLLPNPDVQIVKLMKLLLKIYMTFFDR